MIITEINNLLSKNFEDIHNWVLQEGLEKWDYAPETDRWTTGQHIYHLYQSNQALFKGLKIPDFIKRYQFGKRNRDSRDYNAVVVNYQEKLSKVPRGAVAPISANMPLIPVVQRDDLLKQFYLITEKVKKKSIKISEKKLDNLLLPHPLMGRMTIREILMWNAYHTKHHLNVLHKDYL